MLLLERECELLDDACITPVLWDEEWECDLCSCWCLCLTVPPVEWEWDSGGFEFVLVSFTGICCAIVSEPLGLVDLTLEPLHKQTHKTLINRGPYNHHSHHEAVAGSADSALSVAAAGLLCATCLILTPPPVVPMTTGCCCCMSLNDAGTFAAANVAVSYT